MKLKVSRYNSMTVAPDGATLLHNKRTGALLAIRLPEEEVRRIITHATDQEADRLPLDSHTEVVSSLVKYGFLVEKDYNELSEIRRAVEAARSAPILRLTIVPTRLCNFRCTYCWESHQGPRMGATVVQSIIKFVEKQIDRYKLVDVTWFGGEPLLEWGAITEISERLMDICNDKGSSYTSSLITNGYLLDDAVVSNLRRLGVDCIVTSIDGPAHIHNVRRALADGRPTLERIMENLRRLSKTDCHITVQVNCDSTTVEHVPQVLDTLEAVKRRITVHFRWLFPSDAKRWSCATRNADADNELLLLNKLAVSRGFDIRNPMVFPRWVYCNTDYKDHWLIDPVGSIFKCNVEFELNNPVGKLKEDGELDLDEQLWSRWLAKDPFNRHACKECTSLPICLGGCVFALNSAGSPRCIAQDERLTSEYIILKYQQSKSQGVRS